MKNKKVLALIFVIFIFVDGCSLFIKKRRVEKETKEKENIVTVEKIPAENQTILQKEQLSFENPPEVPFYYEYFYPGKCGYHWHAVDKSWHLHCN